MKDLVLIETYWNVNDSRSFPDDHQTFVLIETYWNVNISRLNLILSTP